MANELEVIDETPAGSLIDAALSPFTRIDGFSASSLIPELKQDTSDTGISDGQAGADSHTSALADPMLEQLATAVETLGGMEGLQSLINIASTTDPVTMVDSLLNSTQKSILLYSIIDDQQVQQTLFADPQVQQAISDAFFGGLPLPELVESVAESFQPDPAFQSRQQDKAIAFQEANKAVQTQCFLEAGRATAQTYGVDLESNSTAAKAWFSALSAFLWANQQEVRNTVSLTARGKSFQATVARARLENKYKAHMLSLLEQVAPKSKTKPTAVKAKTAAPKAEFDAISASEQDIGKQIMREMRSDPRWNGK